MLDRDALIAHFVLLGWEPACVIYRQWTQGIAMVNDDRAMFIDSRPASRRFGNVVRVPVDHVLAVKVARQDWGALADHSLREFYRALTPDRSSA
jgi:hypothetical protein